MTKFASNLRYHPSPLPKEGDRAAPHRKPANSGISWALEFEFFSKRPKKKIGIWDGLGMIGLLLEAF